MERPLVKTGRMNSNVQVGKYTALVLNVTNYPDGCDVPAGANAAKVLGIAEQSILPNGFNDYSGGVYQIVSGTAWPAGANPASALGRAVVYTQFGITRGIAASAIAAGDRVNIADAQGRLKTITETTALVNEVGFALSPASAANDVFRLMVNPISRNIP